LYRGAELSILVIACLITVTQGYDFLVVVKSCQAFKIAFVKSGDP